MTRLRIYGETRPPPRIYGVAGKTAGQVAYIDSPSCETSARQELTASQGTRGRFVSEKKT